MNHSQNIATPQSTVTVHPKTKDYSYTWERLNPHQVAEDSGSQKLLDIHLNRYKTAGEYVKGKRVLDIACGVGYGTQMLQQAGANQVIGVDLSTEAIQYAQHHYQQPNIQFISDNAEEFQWSEKFEVIISFETIEHLPHPQKFLQRVRQLLSPEGIFLLSVPLGETRHFDEHHLHAFSQEYIFSLLSKAGFSIEWHRRDECFINRSELLRWGELFPEYNPAFHQLLFTTRGWRVLYDFVIKGGFDTPMILIAARPN
jgi:2-polyprenyl-3-methyl-5-hydroxy-6-metoxy-1,4-benzoquinol methylase